jgi:hypothetical protein
MYVEVEGLASPRRQVHDGRLHVWFTTTTVSAAPPLTAAQAWWA